VKVSARAAGFDAVGISTPAGIGSAGRRLEAALADGHHGTMRWLEVHADRRADPRVLWPEVRSIVMVGLNYGPSRDPLEALAERSRALISVYAQGADYHDLVKSRLKRFAGDVQRMTDGAELKVFVDTAPLMEKPLAAAAGLGWQGRHTNLVSRGFGSWLFLGALLTTAEVEPDAPETDHCGSCRRCLDICPTAAFPAPYRLDARRCIAYLTIEHKGHIAEEFRAPIGNRVFGCDDCLAVCPWNKFAEASREAKLQARPGSDNPPIEDLLALDEETFRKRFAGTPLKRTGRDRVVRNAVIAAGNSADPELAAPVERLVEDPSPLVRAMVAWALPRIGCEDRVAAVRRRALASEADAVVRHEWGRSEGAR
jgi:epoxyqueuosine reductase